MVVLGCLITFFREEEPENSGNSGHRVPDVLNVLSCINVAAAALVFKELHVLVEHQSSKMEYLQQKRTNSCSC